LASEHNYLHNRGEKMGMTYSKAGVDIDREAASIKCLVDIIKKSFEFRRGKPGEPKSEIGHFANFIEFDDKYLVLSSDGVGTKVLVAQLANKYDTIGIDMIAMNVNDIICIGAEPIALVDYLAMEKIDPEIMRELGIGLLEGARQADIAIVGGETATLKDMIKGIDHKGFDLAGAALGFVEKNRLVLGDKIEPGDKIIGLASSGIHTNGLTLARKVIFEKYTINEKLPWKKTVAEELLTPTRIYVKPVLDMLKKDFNNIHGLAHITGGGFLNIKRLNKNVGYNIKKLLPIPKIFSEIQKLGDIDEKEMFRTFNMGVGFCVIAEKEKEVMKIAKKYNIEASVIGDVDSTKKILIEEYDVEL